MKIKSILRAALLGVLLSGTPAADAYAQTLQISQGRTQSALRVPLNRAIVLESDVAFAELSVANPLIADIATLSERTVYVLGKLPGRTTLTLLGPDGRLITNVEIQVSPDIAEFKERLRELMPNEHIEVRTANDGVVLSGTVSSIQKLDQALELAERYAPERVMNMMNVGGVQQVQLKVRFAEMSRRVSKELGATFNAPNATSGGAPIFTPGNTGALASGTTAGTVNFSFGGGSAQINVLLNALESNGLTRTLAEPNLTALSGQSARFLAGGEVPIPVQNQDGGISVDYRPFGVELEFTPTVVDDDIINLVLESSVSALGENQDIGGSQVPSFSTREASTTVEMRDGQSFAIAGILQDEFRDGSTQVPILGDLPIIGALFRSANYQREQTELVIIVTAHLVRPTSGDALVLPTDRIRPPTENELFLYGRVSGSNSTTNRSTRGGDAAAQDFSGNYGYVMD